MLLGEKAMEILRAQRALGSNVCERREHFREARKVVVALDVVGKTLGLNGTQEALIGGELENIGDFDKGLVKHVLREALLGELGFDDFARSLRDCGERQLCIDGEMAAVDFACCGHNVGCIHVVEARGCDIKDVFRRMARVACKECLKVLHGKRRLRDVLEGREAPSHGEHCVFGFVERVRQLGDQRVDRLACEECREGVHLELCENISRGNHKCLGMNLIKLPNVHLRGRRDAHGELRVRVEILHRELRGHGGVFLRGAVGKPFAKYLFMLQKQQMMLLAVLSEKCLECIAGDLERKDMLHRRKNAAVARQCARRRRWDRVQDRLSHVLRKTRPK
eukprot:comp21333_c0_seq1/m.45862 comp21333_c0_seq1/g.45862  ORF comp21333_c0_seq1/g.45862 comp21333_c0_seq1/m.45862 type:complete len:336 (+) comp21333_c0_seq1:807-1814(+)